MKQTAVEWLFEQLCSEKLSWNKDSNGKIFFDKITSDILQQAKAMETEQMCSFAEFVATYPDKNKNYLGEMLHAKSKYDGAERTVDLLEIFKSE